MNFFFNLSHVSKDLDKAAHVVAKYKINYPSSASWMNNLLHGYCGFWI